MSNPNSYKNRDKRDAERLADIRHLIAQAKRLADHLENANDRVTSVLDFALESAADQSRKLHESAHFGATETLLEGFEPRSTARLTIDAPSNGDDADGRALLRLDGAIVGTVHRERIAYVRAVLSALP